MEVIAAMKEPVNRIDRLLWEEANLRELEKLKSRGSVFAKVLWVAFLVGMFVLLTERPWPPSFYEARVQTANAKWEAIGSDVAAKSASDGRRSSSAGVASVTTSKSGDPAQNSR